MRINGDDDDFHVNWDPVHVRLYDIFRASFNAFLSSFLFSPYEAHQESLQKNKWCSHWY